MREIDHAHHAEDHREAEADKCQGKATLVTMAIVRTMAWVHGRVEARGLEKSIHVTQRGTNISVFPGIINQIASSGEVLGRHLLLGLNEGPLCGL